MSYTAYVYAPLNAGIASVSIVNFPSGIGGPLINYGSYTPQGDNTPLWSMGGVTGTLGITPAMGDSPSGVPVINYKFVVNVDGVVTEYENTQSFSYVSTGTETKVWIRVEMLSQDKTYYLRLNFDANGGTGGPSPVEEKATNDTGYVTVLIPSTEPTRSGYSFSGWATNPEGTGTIRQPGGTYTGYGNTETYADHYLYAVWTQGQSGGVHINNGSGFGEYVAHIWSNGWAEYEAYVWDNGWKKGI